MSDQQPEQTLAGSVGAEPVVIPQTPAPSEAMDAAVPTINALEAVQISPDHEAPKADAPKAEVPKVDVAKADAPKAEAVKPLAFRPVPGQPSLLAVETPKLAVTAESTPKQTPTLGSVGAEAPKLDVPGKLLLMSAANDGARTETTAAQRAAASPARPIPQPEAPASKAASESTAGAARPDYRPQQPDPLHGSAFALGGRRGMPAIAAMLALAVLAGGVGGALATAALLHGSAGKTAAATPAADPELAASVARIDSDVANLKASLDQTNQTSLVELNKTAERLDKVEKTQGELAAKTTKSGDLGKLSEAVERLRAAQASAQGTARESAARESTGSVAPAPQGVTSQANTSQANTSQAMASAASGVGVATAANRASATRPDPTKPDAGNQLKVLDGWVLRDVGRGGALIESREGLYEVYAGDPVPGLGKVDAIRRQDGRWVVVTTRGLVVAR